MFAERRRRFMDAMGDGVAVLFAAPERTRSNDTQYRYRQDSYLHYLTGFPEPETVIVLMPGHAEHEFVMFVRPRDPERETWDGRRQGAEGAKANYGADAAFTLDQLDDMLPGFLGNAEKLHYSMGRYPDCDTRILEALAKVRRMVRQGIRPPAVTVDPMATLNEMRLIKTPEEVAFMRQAAEISSEAHAEAMAHLAPGMPEYEIEALIEYVFRRRGASGPAYGTIAGSGINATILHYTENESICRDGDLLLVDAGCEFEGYAADITRTYPVNGRFSPAQRELYEVVLEAQTRAIDRARPGIPFEEVHDVALRALVEGMVRLGIMSGDVDAIIRDQSYKPYYMHRTSHWLGIDVHDVGEYRSGDASRRLEPGMVLTVEPGLYFGEGLNEIPGKYRGIGIRIEDDVLITPEGHEVLTGATPRTIEEIESVMGGAVTAPA